VTGARHASPFHLPFSAASREDNLRTLEERSFDLLVIGGGITGVGIAHDAAGRGLDVALVEAGDLASGTSSRSSRLIHGGLRYLETFDFALVFEALGERARLLELAPHLVHPLAFLYPVYRGGPVSMPKLWAGMWAYDTLSLFRGLPLHRMLDRTGVLKREPEMAEEGLRGGALYHDAQVDDARLTLAVARAAHEAGAVIASHAPVRSFLRGEDGGVSGVVVEDTRAGRRIEARAKLVLCAAGPWTDEVRKLADPPPGPASAPPRACTSSSTARGWETVAPSSSDRRWTGG
jgi:glycerol-3-phosphate dehydrogenase